MNRRAGRGEAYVPTDVEHIANVVTHAVSSIGNFRGCSISGAGLGTGFLDQRYLNGEGNPVRVPGALNQTAS